MCIHPVLPNVPLCLELPKLYDVTFRDSLRFLALLPKQCAILSHANSLLRADVLDDHPAFPLITLFLQSFTTSMSLRAFCLPRVHRLVRSDLYCLVLFHIIACYDPSCIMRVTCCFLLWRNYGSTASLVFFLTTMFVLFPMYDPRAAICMDFKCFCGLHSVIIVVIVTCPWVFLHFLWYSYRGLHLHYHRLGFGIYSIIRFLAIGTFLCFWHRFIEFGRCELVHECYVTFSLRRFGRNVRVCCVRGSFFYDTYYGIFVARYGGLFPLRMFFAVCFFGRIWISSILVFLKLRMRTTKGIYGGRRFSTGYQWCSISGVFCNSPVLHAYELICHVIFCSLRGFVVFDVGHYFHRIQLGGFLCSVCDFVFLWVIHS